VVGRAGASLRQIVARGIVERNGKKRAAPDRDILTA
jgi:hypothetical protein